MQIAERSSRTSLFSASQRIALRSLVSGYFPKEDAYIINDQSLMHPFSVLTLGIFIAGYITARWDLVTRLYELAIFAADHGVVVSFLEFKRILNMSINVSNRFPDPSGKRLCRPLDPLLPPHSALREAGSARDEPGKARTQPIQGPY